jgi:oxaloacetate decarboxylase gamma subunit
MNTELVMRGVELMVVGMGTVFVFLTALVAATTLMSRVVTRFAPTEVRVEAAVHTDTQGEEIAAITAAITEHRKR